MRKKLTFAEVVSHLGSKNDVLVAGATGEILRQSKTIEVSDKVLEQCAVKAVHVMDMTMEEVGNLSAWCDCQASDLWEGMSVQEILNVYRVSAEWILWESWALEDRDAAYDAWDGAVIDPGHKMRR
jgi:predicted nucleotidyltransferase